MPRNSWPTLPDHAATSFPVCESLDQEHLVAHVAQLEGRLHAPDAATNHESVVLHAATSSDEPRGPTGGSPASIAENSRM